MTKTHIDISDKPLGKRALLELLRAVTQLWDSCFDKMTHAKTTRRQAGIRDCFCTVFAKHSLSQALKKNAGGSATGKARVEAKVMQERESVCVRVNNHQTTLFSS